MARVCFEPTEFHRALGAGEDVLTIADGDTVVTSTVDARGFDAAGVQRQLPPNPMTGPFHVEGAEPGDGLEFHIIRMTPNREQGWTIGAVAPNVVDPAYVPELPERRQTFWRLEREARRARLTDPPAALKDWSVPFRPMLGCFGVAPANGQAISTATSGPYGGNMDYRRLGPGATILFPVSRKGAGVYLGDGHFCQGDGEIVGTGIETSFEVEFSAKVKKGAAPGWPRGEDEQLDLHDRQRPPSRSGPAARDDRNAALARRALSPRRHERQSPARAMRPLRHRQRLQPRLFRRLPARQGGPRRVRLKVSPSVANVTLPHLVGKVREARMGCGMSSTGLKYSISGGANAAMSLTARHTPSGLRPPRRSRGRLTLSRPSAYKHHMFSAAAS